MRYLRDNTDLYIAETDEEVMKANNDVWPDDELKNKVLVPQTTREIMTRISVIYFASYIPDELIQEARSAGFTVACMDVSRNTLIKRNKIRISVEGYQDVSSFFEMQLNTFERLADKGLIDVRIDGEKPVSEIAAEISCLAVR